MRAQVYEALSLFGQARQDLAKADKFGYKQHRIIDLRAKIDLKTGRDLNLVLGQWQKMSKERANLATLRALANVHAALGNFKHADRLFSNAIQSYQGQSPFPIIQTLYEWGWMWEVLADRPKRSKIFYELALQRFPKYMAPRLRLARLALSVNDLGEIKTHLTGVHSSSNDPELLILRAQILTKEGKKRAAARLQKRALNRFKDLLRKHPQAYAKRATIFLMEHPEYQQRALRLAKQMLTYRSDAETFAIAIQAATIADRPNDACTFGKNAMQKVPAIPLLKKAIKSIGVSC